MRDKHGFMTGVGLRPGYGCREEPRTMTLRPNEVCIRHWMAYHMRIDLCMLFICPIRSKDGEAPDDTCRTGTWCSVDAFLGHLSTQHGPDLRPALLKRFGKIRLNTGEPRDNTPETMKHLLRLELCSPAAVTESKSIRKYRTAICGMLRRYYEAIDYPMAKSSANNIGEATSQRAFCV